MTDEMKREPAEEFRLTDAQQKKVALYVEGLAVLCKEYPDDESLKELRPMVTRDPVGFLRNYPIRARTARATAIGVPVSGTDLLPQDGLPYINKVGYMNLVQNDARKVQSVDVWVEVYPFMITAPARAEEAETGGGHHVIGASEDGTCIARCKITFQNGEWYRESGSANQNNVGSFVKHRLIEMAETRAFNRTASLATGKGLVSAEELAGRAPDVHFAPQADNATMEARAAAEKALAKLPITAAARAAWLAKHVGTPDVWRLSKEQAAIVIAEVEKQAPEEKKPRKRKTKKGEKNDQRKKGGEQSQEKDEGREERHPAGPHQLQPDRDGQVPLPVSGNAHPANDPV